MYKFERMLRYILNEVETSHHLIRLYFILTILITEDDHNHIIFFSNFITYNKMEKYIAHCRNSSSIQ